MHISGDRIRRLVRMAYEQPKVAVKRLSYEVYRTFHSDEPWISQGAIQFCDKVIDGTMSVFEWGSGSSTTWFASRAKSVVSVEYSEAWYQKLKKQIFQKEITNVELKYISLDHPKDEPTPVHYDPLPRYVQAIHDYPDRAFDLVIVDGHYRWTCVAQCFEKIKPGGYLLVDNSNRCQLEDWGVPEAWNLVHQSSNVLTETTLWQKPMS